MEKTFIFGITVLSFLMWVPTTSGVITFAPKPAIEKIQNFPLFELKKQPMVVAENEQDVSATGNQTTTKNETPAPEPGAEIKEKSSGSSNNALNKPLKSFKPSEEIAAEQAVDFPVDI